MGIGNSSLVRRWAQLGSMSISIGSTRTLPHVSQSSFTDRLELE
jgi:hypothetical protein